MLYCNLGTPDEPTAASVRRYLAEFLSDPRVVEIPRLLWWPLLHGIILPLRSGEVRRQVRDDLDARRLAPEAVDRQAGAGCCRAGWASTATA